MRNTFANVVQGKHTVNSSGVNVAGTSRGNEDLVDTSLAHDDETINRDLSNVNFVDNNTHPLYLHNNDHPGLILIAKKLTGPDNFSPWSRSMQIALNARNKFVLVNGCFPKPETNSLLFAQWERVNDLVITWILNSVADDVSDDLNYVTTAAEVWRELHERFSGTNGHRVYQIMKEMHSLEQTNKSVEVYFHKLKGLWDEYMVLEPVVNCVCGAHKVQTDRDQK